ncbi:Panacea domain-containing protein [Roseibium litorale]|uniref:DUF4065 domain-containing protein n=1 Tax=Roseibium litorale TaxID=2803841 RepID=A0ABR9CMP0_9HYPH|nr:type II toxin-antitoxin system antitoxin SocA domain-containing protein [Roseibium litorale]MBD8892102.1 DUF4065 domain-containing protein [Roseibium litorale]
MPSYDARAIANEFIRRNGPHINQMKLQKLVYIAHGWNLAINKAPLIAEKIEAWDGGPVVRKIWNHLRDYGRNASDGLLADPFDSSTPYKAKLSDDEVAIIEHVWKKYGDYSGIELSEMTHEPGTPWSNAYFGGGRNTSLSQDDIQQHFIELALAGRDKAA